MVTHHITYATAQFVRSARELAQSARPYGIRTRIYRPWSPALWRLRRQHPEIMAAPKGAGYWLWKPYLLSRHLKRMRDGEYLLYTDAAVTVAADPAPLLELADAHEIVAFHQEAKTLAQWTKRDAFALTGTDEERYWSAPTLTATFQVYKAGEKSRLFAEEMLQLCSDPRLLTDAENICGQPNLPTFREHRHDQSIFGILVAKHGIQTHPDPSQFGPMDGLHIFDHHRRRDPPLLGDIRSQLQLGTRLRRLFR